MNPLAEFGRWKCGYRIDQYTRDIDAYRATYGKALGEAHFFRHHAPVDVHFAQGNSLMVGGVSNLIECLIGNGTTTAAQALTFFNTANAYLGVGDSTTASSPTQTDLQAATNKARQVMDTSYPKHTDGTTAKTITAATNASPISITATAHGFSSNDWVVISGVVGNTAANGVFQITVVDANTFTLNGSTGNGAYTSGGIADKSRVAVFQATFGSGAANFAWQEFGVFNAATGGRMLNRGVSSLGTKATGSWTLQVGVGIS